MLLLLLLLWKEFLLTGVIIVVILIVLVVVVDMDSNNHFFWNPIVAGRSSSSSRCSIVLVGKGPLAPLLDELGMAGLARWRNTRLWYCTFMSTMASQLDHTVLRLLLLLQKM